jgi:hypothetical protein
MSCDLRGSPPSDTLTRVACLADEISQDRVLLRQMGKYVEVLLPPLVYLVEANQFWSVGPAAGSLWMLARECA